MGGGVRAVVTPEMLRQLVPAPGEVLSVGLPQRRVTLFGSIAGEPGSVPPEARSSDGAEGVVLLLTSTPVPPVGRTSIAPAAVLAIVVPKLFTAATVKK